MKKHPFIIACALILAGVLSSCFLQKEKPVRLIFSSGQPGGIYFPLAHSIAKVVQRDYPYIKIDVIRSNGSNDNAEHLMNGDADLAIIGNATPGDATIRIIAPMYHEVLHFMVRRDAGIDAFKDIAGKRVALGPDHSGTESLVKRLLEHYGISQKDIFPVNTGLNAAADLLLSGEIDAMFMVTGLKAAVCQKVLGSGKAKLVGFGDPTEAGGEVDGFRLDYPFISPHVIPTYSYTLRNGEHQGEPPQPVATLAVRALLVCRKQIPDDVVHDIAKAIFDNRAAMIREIMVASEIREDYDPTGFQFPFHPGARAYYERDKPFFLVTYAELMGFILSLMIALVGMIVGLKQWISMKKKNRIDRYYTRLDAILNRLNSEQHSKQDLRDMERDLSEMRHLAVRELTGEKLLANESFLIFQMLLSDCQQQVRTRLDDFEARQNIS